MKGKIVFGENGQPDRFHLDGREVTEEEFRAVFKQQPLGDGAGLCSFPPLVSDALAVHPKQIAEAQESAKAKGLRVGFLEDGRLVFESRAVRKAYLKAYGFKDNQGGYGD